MSADRVLDEVIKDQVFYDESSGGVTISGGEPMAQYEFTRGLLGKAKSAGLHTCLETCGFAQTSRMLDVTPDVDLFLWDIKDTDDERHKAYTGVPFAPILKNLKAVDDAGGETVLRCVMIAGVNLSKPHLDAIAGIRNELKNCRAVELLPYHPYGESKREKLGLPKQDARAGIPSDEQMAAARAHLSDRWGIDAA
jgi:pyruvate formate lyase activating enzyme